MKVSSHHLTVKRTLLHVLKNHVNTLMVFKVSKKFNYVWMINEALDLYLQ